MNTPLSSHPKPNDLSLYVLLACVFSVGTACSDPSEPEDLDPDTPAQTSMTSTETTPTTTAPSIGVLQTSPERVNVVAPSPSTPVTQELVLQNTSAQHPLNIESFTFSDPDAFASSCTPPLSLSPGTSLPCAITYTPNAQTITSGQLTIETNSPTNPIHIVPISGRFLRVSASIQPAPETITTPLGTRRSVRLSLRNTSPQPAQLQSLTVRDSRETWTITPEATLPQTLAVYDASNASAAELAFSLEFAPREATLQDSVLEATFENGQIFTFPLQGDARPRGCVRAQPSPQLNFGQVFPQVETAQRTVEIENCGQGPVVLYAVNAGEHIALDNDTEAPFRVTLPFEHSEGVAQDPVVLTAQESISIPVVYAPTEEARHISNLLVDHSAPEPLVIDLFGRGRRIPNACPNAAITLLSEDLPAGFTEVPLGTPVTLDGQESSDTDGEIRGWFWELVEVPEGSAVVLDADSETERIEVTPDVAGRYVVELTVRDNYNEESCTAARVAFEAIAPAPLRVQLFWDNPEDPDQDDTVGSDLDLHVAKVTEGASWFATPYDSFYANANAFWDPETATVVRDDVDGAGPEEITVDTLEPCQWYAVAIHQWRVQFGSAFATLRIFVEGVLVFESPEPMEMSASNQWWDALRIHAPSGTVLMTGLPRADQRPANGTPVDNTAAVDASDLCSE